MSPDWSASPEPVPYVDLSDPQTLNLYSYVRNNPMSRADADGHDFEQAWEKLKEGLNGVTVKVRIGIGVGAKVRAGAVQGKVEAAVKATVQFSEKGKLSVSNLLRLGLLPA